MNAETIPLVDPMQVRVITPRNIMVLVGGVLVMDEYDVEDRERATSRLDFDTEVVDCSQRIFEITNHMLLGNLPPILSVFPSRRWRTMREGLDILELPNPDKPLLYLGNPVRLAYTHEALHVERLPEFQIRSGVELGY